MLEISTKGFSYIFIRDLIRELLKNPLILDIEYNLHENKLGITHLDSEVALLKDIEGMKLILDICLN